MKRFENEGRGGDAGEGGGGVGAAMLVMQKVSFNRKWEEMTGLK